jgi:acyl-homoserine-lactone acylase
MRSIVAGVTALVLATAGAGTASAAAQRIDVTVTRTAHGIAHVRAQDFRSLAYGYAQALAEDTICTLADMYVTVDAERSRFFGPDARVSFRGNGSTAKNLNSDLFFQRIIDTGTVERLAKVPPPVGPKPELLEGVAGFAAGYNAWLAQQGGADGIDDPTCKGKPWVRPISETTVLRRFYQLSLLASSGVAVDGIAEAAPLTGAPDAQATARALRPGIVDERLGDLGSNAYAIGKAKSASGHGLLYGNPHFPWLGSERFYQSHLTIPGKVDVAGGSLLGVPIINIGHTKGFAWSHTVSTARRFVPYELQLVPSDPTAYVFDGQVRRMRADRVTVQARQPDGSLRPVTRTLYSSHLGPMLTSILGLPVFPWTSATAYTLYDANAENFGRLLNHFLDFNTAQSVPEAEAVLDRYQGIPWVNTIAADTAGRTLYADVGTIPHIDRQKYVRCEVALGVALDALQRLPVLDGRGSSCAPGSDADAAVPGILGPSQLPRLRRDDHVSNMNDSYWLTNPDQPLEGFSRIIGDERTQRTLRTRVGIDMLRRAGKLDLDGLAALGFSNRVLSGELWRDDAVALARTLGLGEAADVLAAWDLRNDLDSKGAILWQRFVTRLTGATPLPLPGPAGPFLDAFDPARPVDTPSRLNVVNPLTASALRQAVDDLRGAGLPLDAPPRTGQTITKQGRAIGLQGGPGGSGIFNVLTPVWDPKRGYIDVVHGSSYIQAVELTPGCPRARTLLTYGQSSNPRSPRDGDQTELFAAKRWVTPPFCAKDLEADRSAARVHVARRGGLVVTVAEARGTARPRITVRATQAAGRTRIVVRQGRSVRAIVRRGAGVAVSPRVRRGAYRVEVRRGSRRVTVRARQR